MVEDWGVERAEGTIHALSGWLVFVASLALIFLLHRLMQILWLSAEAEGAVRGGVRVISKNARFAIWYCCSPERRFSCVLSITSESVLPRTALASFPLELRSWTGTDIPIPDETLKRLGTGEFLQRTYKDPVNGGAYVDLYVAYIPDQHALFRHLPQVCLEGAGWSPVESGTTTLAFPGDAPFRANRYLIAKGDDRQLVVFWYCGPRPSCGQRRLDQRLPGARFASPEPKRQRADSDEYSVAARRKTGGRRAPAAFVRAGWQVPC